MGPTSSHGVEEEEPYVLHTGRRVGPDPPLILVLVLVQKVTSPCRVLEKQLLIFQAVPHGRGVGELRPSPGRCLAGSFE